MQVEGLSQVRTDSIYADKDVGYFVVAVKVWVRTSLCAIGGSMFFAHVDGLNIL